jgi:hypothetical protein
MGLIGQTAFTDRQRATSSIGTFEERRGHLTRLILTLCYAPKCLNTFRIRRDLFKNAQESAAPEL